MELLPTLDEPQLVGPRAYAQRRQQSAGSIDPTGWFKRFLAQYKVGPTEGKARFANPQTGGQYMGAAKAVDRTAADLQALSKVYERPGADPLGLRAYGLENFFQAGAANLVPQLEQGANTLRLGAQVFGGAPGEFTNQVADWQRAIGQQQSLGGTFYSQAGAAQAASANAALMTQARAELAGPLDASVGLQFQADKLKGGITALRNSMANFYEGGRAMEQGRLGRTFLGGAARGGAVSSTRDPRASSAFQSGTGRPQRPMGMIGRF